MALKYVNHEGRMYMFPDHVPHADFVMSMKIPKDELIGAGFVRTDADGDLYCYGRAQSLDMGVGSKDQTCLNRTVQ